MENKAFGGHSNKLLHVPYSWGHFFFLLSDDYDDDDEEEEEETPVKVNI